MVFPKAPTVIASVLLIRAGVVAGNMLGQDIYAIIDIYRCIKYTYS